MTMQYIAVETDVKYDDDSIIFSHIEEDVWGEGFMYEVIVYKTMCLASDSIAIHPFAYVNAGAKHIYVKRGYGFTSFDSAFNSAKMEMDNAVLVLHELFDNRSMNLELSCGWIGVISRDKMENIYV